MNSSAQKIQLVIVGGGFAGVRVAKECLKLLPDVQLTLINDSPFHSYHADLYEIATANLDKERKIDFKNITSSSNIPLKLIFKHTKIHVIVDQVISLKLDEKIILTKQGSQMHFDYLVLCLGSTTHFFNIPGAQEYSHILKNTEDALNLRNDLEELVSHSDKRLEIVIAGGGFTGVELAGQLLGFLKKLAQKYQSPTPVISLIEQQKSLLTGLPNWAQDESKKRLQRLGIKLFLDHSIKKVDQFNISTDKDNINYDFLIWTTGIKGVAFDEKIPDIELTKANRVVVESDLRLKNYPDTFVLGDMAGCMDPQQNCVAAATAWVAIEQAKIAARNIQRLLSHQSTKPYIYKDLGFVVPIGEKYALSNIFGLKIIGLLAWILKRFIALRYFLSILTPKEALILWAKGLRVSLANE